MPRYNTVESFWNSVDRSGSDEACWPWLKSKSKSGYGKTFWAGKNWRSHRLAFYLTHGRIPLCVCHHCDNPICCNPTHLFGGDFKANAQDRTRKKRYTNQVGEAHSQSKLTEEIVLKMRAFFSDGLSYNQIGQRFNVDPNYVGQIIKRKTWKHI